MLAVALAAATIPMVTPSGIPIAQATGSSCTASSTTSGLYTVVRFEGAGSCTWTPPTGLAAVDLLVVGGGGGGGGGKAPGFFMAGSGGGGGGGHVTVADGTPVSGTVDVVVGAGGQGGQASIPDVYESGDTIFGGVGGTSSFGSVTASGGDRGGPATFSSESQAGGDGGSSGRHINGYNASTSGGLNRWDGAGGGGGAGSSGGAGTDLGGQGGNGGRGGGGHTSSITGSAVQYGGGGGGGGVMTVDNLSGEGGDGTHGGGYGGGRYSAATNGTDGVGGGGGGGGYKDGSTSAAGGRGGDGVVIIRYFTSARDLVVTTAPGNRLVGGSLQAPVVQIQDGSGGNVALAGRTVTASLTTGTGTLTSTTAVTDASGTATFTGFALDASEGSYVVTFTSDLLASASSGITISSVATPTPTPSASSEPGAGASTASPTPTPSASSTTSTPAPSASASPSARVITPPTAGTSSVEIGGLPVVVRNQPLARGQGLTVSAGPITASVRSTTAGGRRVPLAQNGTMMVTPSGSLPMSVSGLEPGSTVTQTLHSTPISLGSGLVDATGTFTGSATIPANVPSGRHTLVLDGTSKDGSPVTLSIGVTVAAPAVALGASPIVMVRRGGDHAASVLHVRATDVQRGCLVTFRAAKQHRTVRASSDGRASAQFTLPMTLPSSITVTARVKGSGCASRSVAEPTTLRRP